MLVAEIPERPVAENPPQVRNLQIEGPVCRQGATDLSQLVGSSNRRKRGIVIEAARKAEPLPARQRER